MPIYEYLCARCSKTHEVIQKFSDAPLATCPDCSGPVEKLMSMSSFALKGTGWYTTDYKRKSGAPAANTESAATKAATSTPETKAAPAADSKPNSTSSS